jgi:hypothetical protein
MGAFYEPSTKTAYFFTLNITEAQRNGFEDELPQALTHETIHYAIQKLEGRRVSIKFDKVAKKVHEKWNEIYAELF